MLWLLLALACTCAPSDPDGRPGAPPVEQGHFDEWDRLVRAAASGDVETAKVVGADLTEGDAVDHEGAARVGGAKGFLHVAQDAHDVIDAVVVAATGCGECHADLSVPPPALPSWAHHDAAHRATARLAWPHAEDVDQPPPPGEDDAETTVLATFQEADSPGAAAEAVLGACVACHGPEQPAADP